MRKYADVRIDLTVPNREVTEPRQTHCADPDCTGPKPHVAETAGCKWGNPRAASDDEVVGLSEGNLGDVAYTGGYEFFRNKWVGDHKAMCADLVRYFVPRAALSAPTTDDEVEQYRKALRRLADLTPSRANAATAMDLHHTVAAIAVTALSTPTKDSAVDDKWTRDFKAARNFYGSRDDLDDGMGE